MENYSITLADSGIYMLIFNTTERWTDYHRYSNTVYDIGSTTYLEIEEFLPGNVKYVVTNVQDKDQIVFYFIPRDLVLKGRKVLFTSNKL